MTEKTIDLATLDQFTETTQWFPHWFVPQIVYSEGARFVFTTYDAKWLLDQITFSQLNAEKLRQERFQAWRLDVHDDRTARITVEDGNNHRLLGIPIDTADFPQPGITLWMVDLAIMLPSEY
jgi:hypothetical protein